MDSDSSTTQSECEIREENSNEDQRDSIDADDEETYEGIPTKKFRLCRPNNSTSMIPLLWPR